jgi:hypothetical protein
LARLKHSSIRYAAFSDPTDDAEETPAFHAAALDELTRAFVQSGFDLQFLIRTIAATRAYQFTSALSHPSQNTQRAFARMPIKPLTAYQLADSLAAATGEEQPGTRAVILKRFAGSNGEMSILQALWWMNGPVVARATTVGSGRTVSDIASNRKLDTRAKVEQLFLAALSRPPRKAELDRFVKHVESQPAEKKAAALADVFWVLLNTTEFMVND